MSLYTGKTMEKHLKSVIDGGALAGYNAIQQIIDVGSSAVQGIPANAEDRNRTAPFPFCGNRFEFRAVGSNQNVAWPLTVLNSMMAQAMAELSESIEGGMSVRDATAAMLKQSWSAVFNGNGYSTEWHEEAERRGLKNLPICLWPRKLRNWPTPLWWLGVLRRRKRRRRRFSVGRN